MGAMIAFAYIAPAKIITKAASFKSGEPSIDLMLCIIKPCTFPFRPFLYLCPVPSLSPDIDWMV